ncbi:hypothetical protein FQR65_LT17390 [Abscondita terminalis]|nr:hypothetical protein FQR65_LT17390 [Abscondita terminalis]
MVKLHFIKSDFCTNNKLNRQAYPKLKLPFNLNSALEQSPLVHTDQIHPLIGEVQPTTSKNGFDDSHITSTSIECVTQHGNSDDQHITPKSRRCVTPTPRLHVGVNLFPPDGAYLLDLKRALGNFDMRSGDVVAYKPFMMRSHDYLTSSLPTLCKRIASNCSYVQTYNPQVHLFKTSSDVSCAADYILRCPPTSAIAGVDYKPLMSFCQRARHRRLVALPSYFASIRKSCALRIEGVFNFDSIGDGVSSLTDVRSSAVLLLETFRPYVCRFHGDDWAVHVSSFESGFVKRILSMLSDTDVVDDVLHLDTLYGMEQAVQYFIEGSTSSRTCNYTHLRDYILGTSTVGTTLSLRHAPFKRIAQLRSDMESYLTWFKHVHTGCSVTVPHPHFIKYLRIFTAAAEFAGALPFLNHAELTAPVRGVGAAVIEAGGSLLNIRVGDLAVLVGEVFRGRGIFNQMLRLAMWREHALLGADFHRHLGSALSRVTHFDVFPASLALSHAVEFSWVNVCSALLPVETAVTDTPPSVVPARSSSSSLKLVRCADGVFRYSSDGRSGIPSTSSSFLSGRSALTSSPPLSAIATSTASDFDAALVSSSAIVSSADVPPAITRVTFSSATSVSDTLSLRSSKQATLLSWRGPSASRSSSSASSSVRIDEPLPGPSSRPDAAVPASSSVELDEPLPVSSTSPVAGVPGFFKPLGSVMLRGHSDESDRVMCLFLADHVSRLAGLLVYDELIRARPQYFRGYKAAAVRSRFHRNCEHKRLEDFLTDKTIIDSIYLRMRSQYRRKRPY